MWRRKLEVIDMEAISTHVESCTDQRTKKAPLKELFVLESTHKSKALAQSQSQFSSQELIYINPHCIRQLQ